MPARRAFGDAARTTKAGYRSRDDTGFGRDGNWETGWRAAYTATVTEVSVLVTGR